MSRTNLPEKQSRSLELGDLETWSRSDSKSVIKVGRSSGSVPGN